MTDTEQKPKRVYDLTEARDHFVMTLSAPPILCINKRKDCEEKLCETYGDAFAFYSAEEEEPGEDD